MIDPTCKPSDAQSILLFFSEIELSLESLNIWVEYNIITSQMNQIMWFKNTLITRAVIITYFRKYLFQFTALLSYPLMLRSLCSHDLCHINTRSPLEPKNRGFPHSKPIGMPIYFQNRKIELSRKQAMIRCYISYGG